MSLLKDKVALVCLDFAVRWIDAYPAKSRTTEEVLASLADFKGPDVHVKAVYSDNASEIMNAVKQLHASTLSVTCTPHVPQTNGAAENCVRKITEGTSCSLVQSGFNHKW